MENTILILYYNNLCYYFWFKLKEDIMNTIQRIAKNTSLLFISQIITYLLVFLSLTYMARYLGVEKFGILSFALSFAGILIIFADLGLSTLMTREVARDRSMIEKYIINVIILKVFLVILTSFFSLGLIYYLNYDAITILVIFLVILSFFFNSFSLTFYSLFQALEAMEYQSLGQVLNSLFLLIGVLVVIYLGLDILGIAAAYFITGIIITVYTVTVYIRRFSLPKINFNLDFSKDLLKKALPLSFALIFSSIAFRIDTVILALLVGNVAVGLYTSSYRLIEVLVFIPSVFTAAIYPVASNFYISSHDSLKIVHKKSIEYLTMASIPIVVLGTMMANEIILLIYGSQFTDAVIALQILIWATPFIFLSFVFATLIVSINKQKLALKIAMISMIVNIVLNLIFIPLFSYVGSSFITVITELTDFALYFLFLSHYLYRVELEKIILKPVIAGILMGLFIYYVDIPFFSMIFIAPVVYLISLTLLKAFSKEDTDILKQIIGIKGK